MFSSENVLVFSMVVEVFTWMHWVLLDKIPYNIIRDFQITLDTYYNIIGLNTDIMHKIVNIQYTRNLNLQLLFIYLLTRIYLFTTIII